MDVDSSSARDTPPSPQDGHPKEAISRAYRDIFAGGSGRERAAKRANVSGGNKNNASRFSQDAGFPQGSAHPTSAQSYKSCPVDALCPAVPNDNQPTFHNVDNNRYTYLASTNRNHNQSNATTPHSGISSHPNSFHGAGRAANPASCPWKLAPGAKVLVRRGGTNESDSSRSCAFENVSDPYSCILRFSKACPLNTCPVSGAERTSQEIWESFSQCFTPAVKEVVEFAKGIPGFQELSQQDQVMLLKSGTFQVLT